MSKVKDLLYKKIEAIFANHRIHKGVQLAPVMRVALDI